MRKLIALIFCSVFLLALAPADNQYFRFQTIIGNPGFENLKAGWTAAGSGSFTITQTAANVGSGISSASFDAAAASDTLTSAQVTLPSGLYGQSCRLDFLQKGGDSNLTAKVIDGSLSNVATLALSARTNFTLISLDFTCPTSGTVAFQILAGANAAVVYLDQIYIGLASAVTTNNIVDATIVNADISASAAIDGSKVTAATNAAAGTVTREETVTEGDLGTLTISGTWTPDSKKYKCNTVGGITRIQARLESASAGTTVTQVAFDLPAACRSPSRFSTTGSNEIQSVGTATGLGNSGSIPTGTAANAASFLYWDGSKYIIYVTMLSVSAKLVTAEVTYYN